jgi:hypothetical protein
MYIIAAWPAWRSPESARLKAPELQARPGVGRVVLDAVTTIATPQLRPDLISPYRTAKLDWHCPAAHSAETAMSPAGILVGASRHQLLV